jgi:hypothetical protein
MNTYLIDARRHSIKSELTFRPMLDPYTYNILVARFGDIVWRDLGPFAPRIATRGGVTKCRRSLSALLRSSHVKRDAIDK